MPIIIQDKGSGLYVAKGGGFALEREEAAEFPSEDAAETCRVLELFRRGDMQKHWDLRVVMGPREPKY